MALADLTRPLPSLALFVVLAFVPRPLAAQTIPVSQLSLVWTAPDGCPDADSVRAAVERELGGEGSNRAAVSVRANVERLPGGRFRAVVRTASESGAGERVLEGPSCETLVKATGLLLAMLIDPEKVLAARNENGEEPVRPADRVRAVGGDPSAPPRLPAAPSAPPPLPRPPPAQGNTAEIHPRPSPGALKNAPKNVFELGGFATVGASVGALASATVLLTGGLELGWGPYRAQLGAMVLAPQRSGVVGSRNLAVGGDIGLSAASLSVCARVYAIGELSVIPCLGGELGAMVGAGEGIARPRASLEPWMAISGGVVVPYRLLPWLSVTAWGGAAVPIAPPVFFIEGLGDLRPVSPVEGRAAIGLEVRFSQWMSAEAAMASLR